MMSAKACYRFTFAEAAPGALDEIRRHSRNDVSVTVRLLDAIRAIGLCVGREEDRLALLPHATLIDRGSREALTDEADRAVVAAHHHAALVALRGEPEEERPRLIRPRRNRRMVALLVFAVTLVLAVLVSGLAQRSIVSTAVLFFAAGVLAGDETLGLLKFDQNDAVVARLAEIALFGVLFVDGMKISVRDLRVGWHLPLRALLLGMPITLMVTAVLARYVAGLPWDEALLIGAVLSPTDPVLVSAIVGREEIPKQLRHLLNIESGFNDGLALPVVLVLIAMASGTHQSLGELALEIVVGIAVGVVVPWGVIKLEELPVFRAASAYEPLSGFAIGLLVFAISSLTHANAFLAAFAAGITVATVSERVEENFHEFGELIAEVLQLAALLVFGALLSVKFLREIPAAGYLFAALALVLPRAVAIFTSLAGTGFRWRQRVAAAWFGPKGFASVLYTLWIVYSGIGRADQILHLAALVIAGSIIAHSSTDVLVAN